MTPHPPNRVRLLGAIGWLLPLLTTLAAAPLKCFTCHQEIQGTYVATPEQAFCSRACYEKTLPRCGSCLKRITGPCSLYNGQSYCSDACLDRALPACELCAQPLRKSYVIREKKYCESCFALPHCTHCGVPVLRGIVLADGRQACEACRHLLVFTVADAEARYLQARRDLRRVTGLQSATFPPLTLVGRQELASRYGAPAAPNMVQQGLYRRESTFRRNVDPAGRDTTTELAATEEILLLYGLAPRSFVAAAVHELAHDLLSERYPELTRRAPGWLVEGVCQYLSAAVCRQNGYREELDAIERAPDPEYGGGYRYLQNRFGDGNWKGVAAWLDTVDPASLSATAPALTRRNTP